MILLPQMRGVLASSVGGGGGGDPDYASVLALIPCDTVTSLVLEDIGPLAASGRGINLQTGNSVSGGYLVFGGTARPYTSFPMALPNEWTLEMTLNTSDVTTAGVLFDCRPNFTDPGGMIMTISNGGFVFYNNSTVSKIDCQGTGGLVANVDNHIMVQRRDIAGTLTLEAAVEGIAVGSASDSSNYLSQPPMQFFQTSFGTAPLPTGSKIKDFRVTYGVARYSFPYTPDTPFPTS